MVVPGRTSRGRSWARRIYAAHFWTERGAAEQPLLKSFRADTIHLSATERIPPAPMRSTYRRGRGTPPPERSRLRVSVRSATNPLP